MFNLPALHPFLLSLEVATCATLLTALLGIPLGYLLSRRSFPGRSLLDVIVILPLVLPPTVVGYFLLLALGKHGLLGFLIPNFSLLFTVQGAMFASAVVSLPLVVLPARAAFAAIPLIMFEESRLLGASRLQTFYFVALPMARRGIFSGLMLGFGRALGEFGATMMVVGTSENLRTLPLQIYFDAGENGDLAAAAPAVITLIATSLIIITLANRFRWLEADR